MAKLIELAIYKIQSAHRFRPDSWYPVLPMVLEVLAPFRARRVLFSDAAYLGTASPKASRKFQKLRQESWTSNKGYCLSDAPLFIELLEQIGNFKVAEAEKMDHRSLPLHLNLKTNRVVISTTLLGSYL